MPVVVSNFNYFYHRETEAQFFEEEEENEEAAATEATSGGSSYRRGGGLHDGGESGGGEGGGGWSSGEKDGGERHSSQQQPGNGKALTPTGLITSLAAGLLVGTSVAEKDSDESHAHEASAAENVEKSGGLRGSKERFVQKEAADAEAENSEFGRLLGGGPNAPLASSAAETDRFDSCVFEQLNDSRQQRRPALCLRSVSQPFGPTNAEGEALELSVRESIPNRSRSPSHTPSSKSIKFDDFALHADAGRCNSNKERPQSLHSVVGRGSQRSQSGGKHSQSSYGDSQEDSQDASANTRNRSDSLGHAAKSRPHKTSHGHAHSKPHVDVKADPLSGPSSHSLGPGPPPPAIRRHIIERHRRATVHSKSGRSHDCKL